MRTSRAISAIVCAAVCSGLAGFAAAHTGTDTDLRSVPVDEVLLSADGRTLSASASGTCLPATALRARQDAQTVSVALVTVPRTGTCSSGTETRTWSTTLASPLGTRQVTDSVDGRGVLVFDERALLRPRLLPAGYTHVYDAAIYATGDASAGLNWDASCAQLFADDRGDQLWITQSHGRHWPNGWGPAMPLVAVRHALARSEPGMLAWQEHGQSFLIVSTPMLDKPLTASQLAAVAQSLAPDPGTSQQD